MTAQEALKATLRGLLGPVARTHGYQGSSPTWRKSSPAGDWAVVNVQSSAFSSADHLRCVVNLAFAPEPWLRWRAEDVGARMPKRVTEYLGLYRSRLHPAGTPSGADGWWEVRDSDSATAAVADMIAQLDREGWPTLGRMFSREALMARLREGALGWMKRPYQPVLFARAEALLLMDAGPSDALEERLIEARNVGEDAREHAERFEAWVRAEAAKA